MKVCILGLGEVGLPTALYIKEKNIPVVGYDISELAVKKAKEKGIEATTEWSSIPKVDVYLICVWTGLKDGKPDMSAIFDVSRKISEKADEKTLVSIESTVTVGTSRKIYEEFLKKTNLVHIPHRYWKGDPVRYGVKQMRVIGAINEQSMKLGLKFYSEILDIPLYPVSKIEIAELSKIAENSYRFVQIAFAEELRLICERLNLDFEETRRACNTKWNIEILEAREGIGGHCLPKDTRYILEYAGNTSLIKAAIDLDEEYKKRKKWS